MRLGTRKWWHLAPGRLFYFGSLNEGLTGDRALIKGRALISFLTKTSECIKQKSLSFEGLVPSHENLQSRHFKDQFYCKCWNDVSMRWFDVLWWGWNWNRTQLGVLFGNRGAYTRGAYWYRRAKSIFWVANKKIKKCCLYFIALHTHLINSFTAWHHPSNVMQVFCLTNVCFFCFNRFT